VKWLGLISIVDLKLKTNNMEKTAVEWLEWLFKEGILNQKSFEIAKQKEKEQIRIAFTDGHWDGQFKKLTSEEYYNEQYGK